MGLRSPESDNSPIGERSLRRDLKDNVGSHLMIGILFGFGLALRPGITLRTLINRGPGSIVKGYIKFYKNVRPMISY